MTRTRLKKKPKRQAPSPRRRRAKPKRSKRLKSLPWRPIIGLLVVTSFVWVWLRLDPAGWFRLQTVTVQGATQHLSIEDIETLAQAPIDSPLMALELDVVRRRMERHPWIRSVGLRRLLPGTLYIQVEEHQAQALLTLPEPYLVSEEGIIFKKADPSDPSELPRVTGLKKDKDGISAQVRQQVEESLAIINVLMATGALEPYGLAEVAWQDGRQVTLRTQKEPFEIRLGGPPWKEKMDRLLQVLPHLGRDGRHPTHVLLDQNDGVIVRYDDAERTEESKERKG